MMNLFKLNILLNLLVLNSSEKLVNILVFLVDDLGYGDLGCYGNSTIDSRNIDNLAREGARFTQMYSAAPICTPSRAGFLTGRYPVRLGLTSDDNRFRTFNSPAQSGGLPHDELTIAQLAKQLGYRTGLVGKWHLGLGENGDHLPTRHGFDSFFGMPVTNVQTCGNKKVYNLIGGHGEILDRSFLSYWITLTGHIWFSFIVAAFLSWFIVSRKLTYLLLTACFVGFVGGMWYTISFTLLSRSSCLLYRNETIIEQPVHLEDLTLRNTNEAKKFMQESIKIHKKPFFLYMAYIKVHTALFTLPENVGRSRHGAYGDNIEELDWSVGQITQFLKKMNIDNDTLIFFSSDNGPFLERGNEAGYCGRAMSRNGTLSGPLRGAKGQTWECGIRVPTIMRWPNHIEAGQTIDAVSSLLDFFPSLVDLWQLNFNDYRSFDGISLWSKVQYNNHKNTNSLKEKSLKEDQTNLFHYCGSTITAVRHGPYKVHFYTPQWDEGFQACPSVTICPCLTNKHSPPLIFNIELDPAEESPLNIENHAHILQEVYASIEQHEKSLVSVPNQLETLALPWLFPCCNVNGLEKWFRLLTNSCHC